MTSTQTKPTKPDSRYEISPLPSKTASYRTHQRPRPEALTEEVLVLYNELTCRLISHQFGTHLPCAASMLKSHFSHQQHDRQPSHVQQYSPVCARQSSPSTLQLANTILVMRKRKSLTTLRRKELAVTYRNASRSHHSNGSGECEKTDELHLGDGYRSI